ncbi:MAG: transglutaminase-like domain-containing protein, partial [Gammaproteobacteria bacterium]|nr:transglutaminase-like domain-containing protein [Gammaproteobacteria bacterium]
MKLPIHCTSHVPGRKSALLSAIALICSACATQHTIKVTPPALQGTDVAVRITDVNVLAVSPAMETFLERYILPYPNLDTRLDLLAVAVAENGVLGFNYADSATSTAEETFSSRSGNCISHANMVIALARRAGLDAHYQQVAIQPQWTSREDTVLIRKHINVVLTSPKRTYHLDVSGIHVGPEARITILSDRDGKAMYFNN